MADPVKPTFPHPELTSFGSDRPTPQSLLRLHAELSTNAISVESVRGDGQLGHYALVVPAAKYTAESTGNIPFVPPAHPGPAPIIPANATAAVITEANRQYNADLLEASVFNSVHNNLKKQLLAAVPETYLDELRHESLGFAKVTVLQMLAHLDSTYGAVTSDDLRSNMKDLERAWNADQPLEDLWSQIKRCMTFAAQTDPISELTAVRSALENLENTGLFTDAILRWRLRPEVEHTLANLKTAFNRADKERKRLMTSKSAGFHGSANSVSSKSTPSSSSSITSNSTTGNIASLYYCWSHGIGPNNAHTSETCKFPAPGHRKEATIYNMLGGCNIAHRRKGEVAVYVRPPRNNTTTSNRTAAAATETTPAPDGTD